MEETILLCEDSIEGILSGVYKAYELHKDHATIHLQTADDQNYRLFAVYQEVKVDTQKSGKVLHTIYRRFGEDTYTQLCQAMVSYDAEKADAVYHTIVIGLSRAYRGKLMEHLSNRFVQKVFALSRNTENEIHHLLGFLRFRELQGGVLLARYAPKNDITAMLMPHFANRLPGEDFAVYDEKRQYYAVHPKEKQWYVVRDRLPFDENGETCSQAESEYEALYQHFCRAIAIEERKNVKPS